jgi:hypothetical protein
MGHSLTPTSALRHIGENAALNLAAGQMLINRSYLADLGKYPVQAFDPAASSFNRTSDLRIFRIERIVQDNKQSVLESTTAAYTSLGAAGYSVFLFISSNGEETDLYIGTRGEPGRMLGENSGELLRETFKGHFSGSLLSTLNSKEVNTLLDKVQKAKTNPSASITAVTGVPALSTENRDHFMQGLERFIDAAERRVYHAIILAEPVSSHKLDLIRSGYEQVATQLSPLLKQQLLYGEQDSDSIGLSISQSLSDSLGNSLSLTETRGHSHTQGTSTTDTSGTSESFSSQTKTSKVAALAGPALGTIGAMAFGSLGAVIGGQIGSTVGNLLNEQRTAGTNHSRAEGRNESQSTSYGESNSSSVSVTRTAGYTDSQSVNRTTGASRQISIETTNKGIEQLLFKIDHHLKRINEAKTYGGWNSAAYFIGDSTASSEALASIFLGLVRGSNSSHEDFALTTWKFDQKSSVLDWLGTFSHPPLQHKFSKQIPIDYLTPATLISGKEMAIQLSLPRRSTSTVSVVETQAFGRKVQYLDGAFDRCEGGRRISIGQIRHLWENLSQTIEFNLDQLCGHVFVSGSTGSGKSNTLYELLDQLDAAGIPFLVIEPAKGEYKHVFGHRHNVQVFGTHPAHSLMLRINPFRFPSEIHVLEHVDRLIEIFNVCWPMYAAMPAVLKESILQSYQKCGWDLDNSINHYSEKLFPTFQDLLVTLEQVIENSAYSQELKGNYIGSLSTRVKSLTNGINGQIFSTQEIDSQVLFDSPVIVDLSRIGSAETKALIMGILVMRLSEYRMAQGGMNLPLRHVTVLEEAHNILKRNSAGAGAEGTNVVGKSVEMLTNAIAEMRTYGEGFIIVDQSPHAVDISAIRNTNTKIIMRLPDEMDRRLIGKSVALRDDQLDEIAKLPKGVAIVYQNDWLEPVLCQVRKFSGAEKLYLYQPNNSGKLTRTDFNREVRNLLLAKRVRKPISVNLALLEQGIYELPLVVENKIQLIKAVASKKQGQPLDLWNPHEFGAMSKLLVEVLDCRNRVQKEIKLASDYSELIVQLDCMLDDHENELPQDVKQALQHCMLKDYSMQHAKNIGIYSNWRAAQEARNLQ